MFTHGDITDMSLCVRQYTALMVTCNFLCQYSWCRVVVCVRWETSTAQTMTVAEGAMGNWWNRSCRYRPDRQTQTSARRTDRWV